jgi:hypothetical protein
MQESKVARFQVRYLWSKQGQEVNAYPLGLLGLRGIPRVSPFKDSFTRQESSEGTGPSCPLVTENEYVDSNECMIGSQLGY